MRRVSILMPCRDAAAFLPAAIASIRAQTFADYEVVAVDDGSTDQTFGILYTWAQQDGRVRVLQTHGRGLVAALATGLAAARGEIVARMDADDTAEPDRLARQIEMLDADPHLAACGTLVEYFPADEVQDGLRRYERWLNGLITHDDIARDVFVECPIPHPTLAIRRHVLHAVGGYRELGWPEDYDLVLRLWAGRYRMGKVPRVLHRWRESPERASRTDVRYSEAEFRRIKIYFLQRTLLADTRPAIIWGAGPVGKAFARDLAAAGTPIAAFVDIDPRKIGQQIHGATVIAPDELPRLAPPAASRRPPSGDRGPAHGASPVSPAASPLILAAVGQEGAREDIRRECRRQGLVEGEDFVAIA